MRELTAYRSDLIWIPSGRRWLGAVSLCAAMNQYLELTGARDQFLLGPVRHEWPFFCFLGSAHQTHFLPDLRLELIFHRVDVAYNEIQASDVYQV